MKEDIVQEVQRVREALAAKHNFDIRAVVVDAHKREKYSDHPVVSFAPNRNK